MRLSRMMLSVIGLMLGSAISANEDLPADALQPANRSEVAILMERLAALEQQMIRQDARQQSRIDALQMQVGALESALVLRRLPPPEGFYTRWTSVWFHFDFAFQQQPNGDFARNPTKTMGELEPQPFEVRGTDRMNMMKRDVHSYFLFRRKRESFIRNPEGPDAVQFWVAPTSGMDNPLEGGFLIGTDKHHYPTTPSYFDMLEELLNARQKSRSGMLLLDVY